VSRHPEVIAADRDYALEAAGAVLDAVEELRASLTGEVYERLRYGGQGTPYQLRNLLPDLEGREGAAGWLGDDYFVDSLRRFVEWLEDDTAWEPDA
jgi:hypothetical protein